MPVCIFFSKRLSAWSSKYHFCSFAVVKFLSDFLLSSSLALSLLKDAVVLCSFKLVPNKTFFSCRDFDIVYQLPRNVNSDRPDVFLSLTSDWDLDAAFHTASRPFLQLKVQPFEKDGKAIGLI